GRRKRPNMYRRFTRIIPSFVSVIVILCGIFAAAPKAAFAHAVLVSSQPGENSTVTGSKLAVLLKYNSRIDPGHSTLTLLAPDGKIADVAIGSHSGSSLLSATLTGLVKGAYVLRWQVLASDGHITRGEIPFQVK
ncbi:MAG TPA: copper resistance CopC family protein, partial [Rhizomicrobium sp.]|nr:copper resistance CopC family protein [Rhizomicrobium sp.]